MDQGSTGVLKTSRLPTWVVNFGVGFAHPEILLDAVLCGQPTCHKLSVRASKVVRIAHAAAEGIAASLIIHIDTFSRKQFQLLPHHHH